VTVNAGNTVVAGHGARPLPPRGAAGYRPPPVAYPVYVGGNSGWDAGAVIAGGLVAGATAGLVAGAISNATAPTAVIVEAPAAPPAPAVNDQARQSADAAQSAASEAQRAARQAEAAAAATNPPASPALPPVPPGARYALGTRFAQLPEGCKPESIGPISFDHCGQDWLQPVMEGGTVAWIAVPPPLG